MNLNLKLDKCLFIDYQEPTPWFDGAEDKIFAIFDYHEVNNKYNPYYDENNGLSNFISRDSDMLTLYLYNIKDVNEIFRVPNFIDCWKNFKTNRPECKKFQDDLESKLDPEIKLLLEVS